MCKTKMSTNAAEPISTPRRTSRTAKTSFETSRTAKASQPSRPPQKSSSTTEPSRSNVTNGNYTGSSYRDSSRTSISSRTSLSSLKDSLPENPHIYDFSEICSATNNFLAKKFSSSSSAAWRCSIRGKDVIVFQRRFLRSIETSQLREKLAMICRSHHISIIKLLGASVSGDNIYLVYEYANGANLADCLRNPKNPNFTVLSTWISRMQIATDLAHGLDYIHNFTGLQLSLVHNHIKSSSVIVTEPSFNAKICHIGTAELCGEIVEDHRRKQKTSEITEITEETSSSSSPLKSSKFKRSDSRTMKFKGTRGYMSPEFQSTGVATQKSDVYAFGIVILELLSGEVPLKYLLDKVSGEYRRISVVETARQAIGDDDENDDHHDERRGRLRRWVDRRLKDSFPVDVAERMTRIVLECVHVDPDKRPDMGHVAGKISKLYLESRNWSDNMRVPTEFTASFAPR